MGATQDAAPEPPQSGGCANCGATLQGHYCHACGQSVHNPVREVGHALEEVFESFWHLDGRIFRTLHDLPFPGRVASRYLRGHRVSYVAPLRLFVVLSVLTFLFAQLAMQVAMHGREGALVVDSMSAADTPAEVERIRLQTVAGLQQARGEVAADSLGYQGLEAGIAQVNASARQRLAELQGAAEGAAPATARPADEPNGDQGSNVIVLGSDAAHPIQVSWLPGFANRWLDARAQQIRENLPRIKRDPQLLVHAYLSAVPKTLFVLVPLFALLLRLAYAGSRRLYLEHLVVALYSHAWICLTVLVISLVSLAGSTLTPHVAWAGRLANWITTLLLCALPLYLLVMQKRVYGEGWGRTTLKYFSLGGVYAVIVLFAALLLVMLSIANA